MPYEDFFSDLDKAVSATDPKQTPTVSNLTWSDWHHFTDLMSELTSNIRRNELLDKVLDHAIQLTGAERGFIILLNDKQEKELLVSRGVDRRTIENEIDGTSDTVIRRLFELKQPLLVEKVSDDTLSRQQSIIKMGICSVLGAPLLIQDKVIGVAYVDTSNYAKSFTTREQDLFSALARIAAIAIENSRLYSSLEATSLSLQETTDYLDNLLRSLPLGVVVFGADRLVHFANAVAKQLLFGDANIPLPRTATEAPFFQSYTGQKLLLLASNDSRVELPSDGLEEVKGKWIHHIPFTVSKTDDRKLFGLLVSDHTRQRMLEMELMKLNKFSILSQVAGAIAHEINNALSPAVTSLSMIQLKDKEQGRPQDELLEIAIKQMFRTSEIVQDLRNLSRPKQPIMERIDLIPVIESAIKLIKKSNTRVHIFEKSSKNHQFSFEQELPDSPVYILGDSSQLEGMFYNLLINSAQALEAKGKGDLTLKVKIENKSVIVSIVDEGIGILEDKLPHIFEPYFTTKDPSNGTGLGMTIVDMVATAHQAKLDVKSTYGLGTTVTIRFNALH